MTCATKTKFYTIFLFTQFIVSDMLIIITNFIFEITKTYCIQESNACFMEPVGIAQLVSFTFVFCGLPIIHS